MLYQYPEIALYLSQNLREQTLIALGRHAISLPARTADYRRRGTFDRTCGKREFGVESGPPLRLRVGAPWAPELDGFSRMRLNRAIGTWLRHYRV